MPVERETMQTLIRLRDLSALGQHYCSFILPVKIYNKIMVHCIYLGCFLFQPETREDKPKPKKMLIEVTPELTEPPKKLRGPPKLAPRM